MRFNCDAKALSKGIEKCLLKGKYFTSGGLKNSELDNYVHLEVVDDIILYNADSSLCVSINVPVTRLIVPGSCIIEASKVIAYLKNYSGEVTIEVKDTFRIVGGGKTTNLPVVLSHPNSDLITRFKNRFSKIEFEAEPTEYPKFTGTEYKTWVQTTSDAFTEAIKACEVVGLGVYKLDFDGEELIISSKTDNENFHQAVFTINCNDEPATLEYTGPLHKIFDGPINFFFNDDSPLLIIGANAKLMKAPFLAVD